MGEVKFSLASKGAFDLGHLYNMIHDWLRVNGWESVSGAREAEKCEILYRQQDLSDGYQEHQIWWRLKKKPGFSSDFEYTLNINLTTRGMSKKEITEGGSKRTVDSGEISIDINCSNKFLPEDEWKTPFEKKMMWIYKRWKGELIARSESDMYVEVYTLQAHIKRYLNLRQFIPAPEVELFHPSKEYSRGSKR